MGANCPFYGCHVIARTRGDAGGHMPDLILVHSQGNQCGLATGCISPCAREVAGLAVEWDECRVMHEHLVDLGRR